MLGVVFLVGCEFTGFYEELIRGGGGFSQITS